MKSFRDPIPITYAGLVRSAANLKNVTALWRLGRFLQRDQVDIVHLVALGNAQVSKAP